MRSSQLLLAAAVSVSSLLVMNTDSAVGQTPYAPPPVPGTVIYPGANPPAYPAFPTPNAPAFPAAGAPVYPAPNPPVVAAPIAPVYPANGFVAPPPPPPQPAATVTPLYTPVTLFNWWRPRTLAGYMITPQSPTITARPVFAAPAAAAAPVTAYYQPSYHPAGIVVAVPPTAVAASGVPAPATASVPVFVQPPIIASAPVAAPAPVVFARPVLAPRPAYLYSRGPLGFPRLDPVPAGTVVQPAAVPFIPAILP
ncbi:MAG: hypothetical protein ACKO38_17750 [Planctomycetota bacterium]